MVAQRLPMGQREIANGLYWVRSEIENSLAQVRARLEQYLESEDPGDRQPLLDAFDILAQVRGTVRVVQCHGAAVLGDEMLKLLRKLVAGKVENAEAGYEVLSGATLQLSDYIDLLALGEPDQVIILQPILNELRLAQAEPLLTEAELFAAQLQGRGDIIEPPTAATGEAQALASRELGTFQLRFVAWYRRREPESAMHDMSLIAGRVAEAATAMPLRRLWWCIALLMESVAGEQDVSIELKRLLGRTVEHLRRLASEGEAAAATAVGGNAELLLYYLTRVPRPSFRGEALIAAHQLRQVLPDDTELEQVRHRLRLPNTSVLEHVHHEIQQDLRQVKDAIDLMVRTHGRANIDLGSQRQRLQRLADTLGVLGLQYTQQVLSNQARIIADLAPDSAAWIDTATALLRAEHGLEEALFRSQARYHLKDQRSDEEIDSEVPPERDLREATTALLRESLVDLAQAKAAISGYIAGTEAVAKASVERMFAALAANLDMIKRDRAGQLVRKLEQHVAEGGLEAARERAAAADRLADAVACVELYLEAVRDGLPQLDNLLARLEQCMDALQSPQPVTEQAPVLVELAESAAAAEPASTEAPEEDAIDPEIREVFIEEAKEVLVALQGDISQLRETPEDQERLAPVRRAFHTLKGSGRMVGAESVAALAWAVEQTLNLCLDGTLKLRTGILDLTADAVALMPELVEQLGAGKKTSDQQTATVQSLVQRAEQLRHGEQEAGSELYGVFRDDARERVALIAGWLEAQGEAPADVLVEPEVIRAFHTLRGSAAVVRATPVQRISRAFETYLNQTQAARALLSSNALELMSETLHKLQQWIGDTDISATAEQEVEPLLQRLEALHESLPAAQAAASAPEENAQSEAPDHDAFTMQTLDALQTIEAELREWHQQAVAHDGAGSVGHSIRTHLDGLAAAARIHDMTPMAEVCTALSQRLASVSDASSPLLASALEDIVEDLYQQLDACRAGEPLGDAASTLDRIAGLPVMPARWGGHGASREPAAESTDAEFAVPSETLTMGSGTPEPAPEGTRDTSQVGDDSELRGIFLEEAQELMQDYHQALEQANQALPNSTAFSIMRRVLHTLKGSARMAGLEAVGAASQRYEGDAAAVENDMSLAAVHLPRLRQAEQELRQLLDAAGLHIPSTPQDAAAAPPGGGAPVAGDQSVSPDEPEQTPAATPWESVPSEPASTPAAVEPGNLEPALIEDEFGKAEPDAELIGVFLAESGELLETIDNAFDDWAGGADGEAVQDMRRALHTLKGSAYVSGLKLMGDRTHALETRFEEVLRQPGPPNEVNLQPLRAEIDALHQMQEALRRGDGGALREVASTAAAASQWHESLFWQPDDESGRDIGMKREYARVPVVTLNTMLNQSGEISIFRARLQQHASNLRAQLVEMTQTVSRIRGQLRMLDAETDAQIAARGLGAAPGQEADRYAQDFDPLELDRYSRMQELSRALAEAVNDISSLYGSLDQGINEAEALLQQQGQVDIQIQQGLMGTLKVPFSRQQGRFERLVRQSSLSTTKRIELHLDGADTELDRNVLEGISGPISHLLRNAVVHGIEAPEQRRAAHKPESGRIDLRLRRESEQLLIELSDDGRGLDFDAIRAKAIERGRLQPDVQLTEDELARFIFEPGFSTAGELTEEAGRGVGMDVVASAVRQLGGTLELRSRSGQGTRFLIRLPLTLAVSQALLVEVAGEYYAVPMTVVTGISRIPADELASRLSADAEPLNYGGQAYPVRYLGDLLDLSLPNEIEQRSLVTLMVHAGETLTGEERRVALVVDAMLGNRELIAKPIGPQLSSVAGIGGASVLADGHVVLILDLPTLVAERARRASLTASMPSAPVRSTIMVADDSVTMRRVAERLLDRAGYRVVTARDGMEAIAMLHNETPAVVLLDIEMPRADGFEVADFIRNDTRLAKVPIIMITSRSGDKHRERARRLGVNRYLIKPYQENQLLEEIRSVEAINK